ncbi:hypothetical protein NM208_g3280 [Fusarium decemcellulare]|uniref:Uncharacterized protein n=1 Tax=Fusarium decemcellulare TaxID=57161 RepID=A0ACC1SPT7_9HYPO|nr:hypothetical protein NM208_g3280 [Fusarium decemcellulare]
MRLSLLLAGFAAVPGPALCVVSNVDGFQPIARDVSPPIRWASEHDVIHSETTALSERDPSHFESKTRLAISVARRTTLVATGAISFWGLVRDCKSFSDENDASDGVICVGAAIGSSITAIAHIQTIGKWFVEYGKEIAVLALGDFTHDAINRLQGIGPWLNGVGVGAIGDVKRDHLFRRAAETSSKTKGSDASTVDRPVFGFQSNGAEYHFTIMDIEAGTNKTHIKLGHGPGPETEHSKRTLQARKPKYNGQWFDHGGLDIIGRSDQPGDQNSDNIQPDINNQGDFDWIMAHVECSLGLGTESRPAVLDEPGLYFQIYDDETRDTLALGAMSPFMPDQPSLIQWMDLEAGLSVEDPCVRLVPG